jgi:hypothetical protein
MNPAIRLDGTTPFTAPISISKALLSLVKNASTMHYAPLVHFSSSNDRALIDFIRTQNWHVIDAETKLVVLHEINGAIAKLRIRDGMSPFDDGLPDDRNCLSDHPPDCSSL